jgi:predicted glycoside hydrolase/deacetylase ChbG (UPF0249 family)
VRATHFDSHGHFHTQWPIATIVMELAERYGVRAIPPQPQLRSRHPSRQGGVQAVLQQSAEAPRLRTHSALRLGGRRRVAGASARAVEIMVHPGHDASGAVVDLSVAGPPLQATAETWSRRGRLASYAELI